MAEKFLDIVTCGPDFSGTSTQIEGQINFFKSRGMKVKGMRGTEHHALFHAECFNRFNKNHDGLASFLNDPSVLERDKRDFIFQSYKLLSGTFGQKDMLIPSMVQNEVSAYINPNSADVWIFEEPTRRGAGQVNRTIEQYRSKFNSQMDPISAAITHSVYRIDEWLRFRRPIREAGKKISRSRSEESACYQIEDKEILPNGTPRDFYLNLPGHKIAFGNAPTHIFIVCAPADWTSEECSKLNTKRNGGRILDDHETNIPYQLLVNKRYATTWLEELYGEGCKMHGGIMPKIIRFPLYQDREKEIETPIDEMNKLMSKQLELILQK